MGKPDAPTPPNPIATAAGQTSTNVSTAVANAFLNNANQLTPDGELRYDPTGSYGWTDPVSGASYNIPRFTATQILSPNQQEIKGYNTETQKNLAWTGEQVSEKLGQHLSQNNLSLDGAPAAGDPNSLNTPQASTSFGYAGDLRRNLGYTGFQQSQFGDVGLPQFGFSTDVGSQQHGFGPAGDITRSYGPQDDFSSDRGRVEEALYGRLQPQLEKDRSRLEQQLADQGIRYGSQAYNDAMDNYNRQSTDARLAVTAQGGQEQQRMMDMAAQRAGFQNAAQQQAYTQAQGRGTFANQAQATDFAQNQSRGEFANKAQELAFKEMQARGEFANTAQQQQFQQTLQGGTFENQAQKDAFQQEALKGEFENAGLAQQLQQRQAQLGAQNTARGNYLTEQTALRNQPINEVSALMSGSQVSQPNWVNMNTSNIPTTDVAGLINNRFSQDMGIYQQQSASFNSLIGGIFGAIGGLGKGLSDRTAKENIDKVGTIFAAGPDGEHKPLPIYEWEYKKDIDPSGDRHVGPMAQDVEKIDKRAVYTRGGKKHIDMTRMGSILKAA